MIGRVIGLLLAFVAGCLAGVLLAPAKGRRSRALLRDKALHTSKLAQRRSGRLTRRVRGRMSHLRWARRRRSQGAIYALTPQELEAQVQTALGRMPGAGTRFNVNVEGQTVILRGHADPESALLAQRLVEDVPGVAAVRNLVHTD